MSLLIHQTHFAAFSKISETGYLQFFGGFPIAFGVFLGLRSALALSFTF